MTEKRTDTLSLRCSPSLRRKLEASAIARDTTLSDLLFQLAVEHAERERMLYERLGAAYAVNQDLPLD